MRGLAFHSLHRQLLAVTGDNDMFENCERESWKVSGFFKGANDVTRKYTGYGKVTQFGGKWRVKIASTFVEELDRQVIYLYLCQPEGEQIKETVRFTLGFYHDGVGPLCPCEDKVSEPVDFSKVPPGCGVGFSWFFEKSKLIKMFRLDNDDAIKIHMKMEYVKGKPAVSRHRIELCRDYDVSAQRLLVKAVLILSHR